MPDDGFKQFESCARVLGARLASEGKPSLAFALRSAEEIHAETFRKEVRAAAEAFKAHPVLARDFAFSIAEFDREDADNAARCELGLG